MRTGLNWVQVLGVVTSAASVAACSFALDDEVAPSRENVAKVESQQTIDPTYAVGVIPIGPAVNEGGLYGKCPNGIETVTIYMDDEDDNNQTAWGHSWRLPQDTFDDLVLGYDNWNTRLQFCRVNGTSFRPMGRDVNDKGHFYAVLRLGSKCPNGSTIMYRFIENENDNNESYASGPYQPNSAGPNTMLHFCYFREGSGTNLVDDVPNLGFPYAVYHDFDGPQPYPFSLGLGKARHVSDDEDSDNGNISSGGTAAKRADFSAIISEGRNTTFDLARVY